MMKTDICIPIYHNGRFCSLRQAAEHFIASHSWSLYLPEIVQYNLPYRDYLRTFGLEALIGRLVSDAPVLSDQDKELDRLRTWYEQTGTLAPYDIQCYDIKDKVSILGHEFDGLRDIQQHRVMCAYRQSPGVHFLDMGHIKAYPDIHIGELYENYPVFDIYDMGDSRTYQNFFFRERPFSHADLEQRATIPSRFNYCMVHEHIAEEFLPVLYYEGTGDYMLLATAKKTRTDTSGVCR